MGRRSGRLKFRKRRQRAGFVLFVSFAIVVLGGILLFRLDPLQGPSGEVVSRVESPTLAEAPKAAPEQEQAGAEANDGEDKARGEEKETKSDEPEGAPVPESKDLWLTVPKIGLYDNYVANSSAPEALDVGAAKLESTEFPWQENGNTYISAHRLGWPGTASDHQFYNLPLLAEGDEIYLTDANGTTYTYEVSETLEVSPYDTWVINPVGDRRDVVSLPTCIENFGDYWTMGPTWSARYVVRGDLVKVEKA